MGLRHDSKLKFLLLDLHELASPEIASHFMDALDLMGPLSPYKGGKRLLELLEFIVREADQAGDAQSAEGARDAVAYMTGRLLTQDLSMKYDSYDDSGQLSDLRSVEYMMGALNGFVRGEIDKLLTQHPEATAADIRAHFEHASRRAVRFVTARRAGHYGAFRIRSDISAWMADVLVDRIELHVNERPGTPVDALLAAPDADLLVAAAQLQLRRTQLDLLEVAVENPYAKEQKLQRLVERSAWLFGGAYTSVSEIRSLMPTTQVDLALLRPDGVLHVVELKKANTRLVKLHRGVPVTTDEANLAVSQVSNYLRLFDENRVRILDLHGIDARRASATIVIGHPMYDIGFTESQVNETLRIYNSDRVRAEIITYKQLIDGARRSLDLSAADQGRER